MFLVEQHEVASLRQRGETVAQAIERFLNDRGLDLAGFSMEQGHATFVFERPLPKTTKPEVKTEKKPEK